MNIITLNQSNVQNDGYNNRFIYKLNRQLESNQFKISLFSFSIPYSIPNISSIYDNNKFQTKYNNITYDFTIDEGYYNITSLNNYFKYVQKNTLALPYNVVNGIDTFFFEVVENQTYYSTQLILSKATLTGVAGHNTAVYNNNTFQVKFNSNLSTFLGFNKDVFYPPSIQSVNYSILSKDEGLIPNLTPVFSLQFNCNLIENEYSENSQTIFTYVPLNIQYGALFYFQLNPPLFFLSTQKTDKIIISILDQNNNRIKFLDNNMAINVLIEKI